ncbi:hypothetical protein Phi18:2_gp54 [Cellulophaga phage phi18:2]|uniref:Uncharacterized protein n=2 Tax=Cellulophaga phage phi18:1 TaxID=1327982 RepID=S0A451_9CAUD|nr:hypothetical protein Phi18:1_gp56 [Cellulophaga phage phi18:1]AGO48503.1 hypothetical protein Phi18:1_gp56 [Cellulophaga phage phi18:1]AGO49217.1 hypothetical protein Phi18:2_gp54 [Cellulophaga phage phi18:2]
MTGKIDIKIGEKMVHLWFNNYSKAELAKIILPKDKGNPAKPEEFPLLRALNRLAEENYLDLMRDIIWVGILGSSFANDEPNKIEKKEVSNHIATAPESVLYSCWLCFLDAMGVNIDHLEDKITTSSNDDEDESKKKIKL